MSKPRKQVTARVRHLMSMAARLLATGKLVREVAEALQISEATIYDWQSAYHELWEHDFRRAMHEVLTEIGKARHAEAQRPKPAPRGELDGRSTGQAAEGPLPVKPIQEKAAPLGLWALVQLYEQYHPDCSPGNLNQLSIAVRLFERWAGRVLTLDDLSAPMVIQFLSDYLRKGSSPATVNCKRCYLLALWRFARKLRLCSRGPHDIPRMRERPELPEAWTVDEIGKILTVASKATGDFAGVPAGQWWTSLLLTLYDSGERIGAAKKLTPQDLDLDAGLVVFPAKIQKTGRPRLRRLHPETIAACRAVWSAGRPLMWPCPVSRETLEQRFRAILSMAGVRYGRGRGGLFHKVRRTSGSLIEAAGGDGSAHLGNTRVVFERNYKDPRLTAGSALVSLPRPVIAAVTEE
jgi:integrase